MKTQNLKIGQHRGNSRVWLDNKELLKGSGFAPGKFYAAEFIAKSHKIILTLAKEGRKVTSKGDRPIIDLSNKKVGDTMGGNNNRVLVEYQKRKIIITGKVVKNER